MEPLQFGGETFSWDFNKDQALRLWQRRLRGELPVIIDLSNGFQKTVWLYLLVTANEISQNIVKPGWTHLSWQEREGDYKKAKTDKLGENALPRMIVVICCPGIWKGRDYTKVDQNGRPILNLDEDMYEVLKKILGVKKVREAQQSREISDESYQSPHIIHDILSSVLVFFDRQELTDNNFVADRLYEYQLKAGADLAVKMELVWSTIANCYLIMPCRAGKFYTAAHAMCLFKQQKPVRSFAIITPYPEGWQSAHKTWNLHVFFREKFCLIYTRGKKLARIKQDWLAAKESGKIPGVFISWAKTKHDAKATEDVVSFLASQGVDILIADECQREEDTLRSELIKRRLKPAVTIGVSATPFTEILVGKASLMNSVIVSEDFITAERARLKLPDYHQTIFCKNFLEEVKSWLRVNGSYEEEEEFTWAKLWWIINDPISGKRVFKFAKAILAATEDVLGDPRNDLKESSLAFICQENRVLRHILNFVSSSEAAQLFADLINKNFPTYRAICWTSQMRSKLAVNGKPIVCKPKASTEERLTQWQIECEKAGFNTIIVTCESLVASVTLQILTAVWIATNISSPEVFIQMIGRCNNTNPTESIRQTAAILPKGILLDVVAHMAPMAMKLTPEVDYQELVRIILRNMNVLSFDGSKWTEYSRLNLIGDLRGLDGFVKKVGLDEPGISYSALANLSDSDISQMLKRLRNVAAIGLSRNEGQRQLGDGGDDGKTKELNKGKTYNKDHDNSVDVLRKKIENIFNRLPFLALVKQLKSFADFESLDQSTFQNLLGTEKDLFLSLYIGQNPLVDRDVWDAKLKFNFFITRDLEDRLQILRQLKVQQLGTNIVFDPTEICQELVKSARRQS
jgi:hypothetical protein